MISFVLILFNSNLFLFAQRSCEEFPSLVDSAYNYTWNLTEQVWELNTIQYYSYTTSGKIELFNSIDSKTRLPLVRREYNYDIESKLSEAIFYRWVNDKWQNLQLYTYNTSGTDIIETIYKWIDNEWQLYGKMINYYENGRRVGYTGQLVNKQTQELYDYGYFYISYTDFGKINMWFGERVSDGSIIFRRNYFYNDKNRLFERHIYTPVAGDLQLNARNLYYYDIYDLHIETVNQKPVDDGWENTEKNIYYRRIHNAKRVAICHNGRTICIARQAVPAHLAHGDVLGVCAQESQPNRSRQTSKSGEDDCCQPSDGGKKKSTGFIDQSPEDLLNSNTFGIRIYPNPAKDVINISFNNNELQVNKIELIDLSGRVLMQVPVNNETLVSIPRGDLQKGVYFVRVYGKETENRIVVIE